MWDIYVLGDLKFLASVFNAVAMILAGNLLVTAVKIFFLLAVLQLALAAVFRQQGVAWSQLIVTWLAFSLCFLPKVQVALHDRSSLKSISVANVPLGIAVFGSISSNLGKVVTDSLQAVMHSTSGQQYQVATSFNELLRLRSQLLSKGFLSQEQQQNWQNYNKDCLEVGLKLNAPSERSLNFSKLLETSLPQALRFNSQVYFTQVISGGKAESLSCEQAYQRLSNGLRQSIRDYVSGRATNANSNTMGNSISSNLSGLFNGTSNGITSANYLGSGGNSTSYASGVAGNFIDLNLLNQEIKAISRGQLAAQDYMLAIALAGIILEAPEYSQLGQVISQQNLSQLYSQWSLQGDLFFKTVKPVLTFLEGFFYAVSPVVMLLMLLNSYGLNLLGKYALFLIWLQMWQPIIVIINLYYQHAIELQLSQLQQQTIALDSFIGITRLQQELESYVATSGMLVSAVGTLALFLLYGGAITATSLASKLTPVTASATQSLSPDLTSSAPVLSTSSRYQNDNLLGSRMQGSDSMIGSINLGSSLQSVLSASQTALRQTGASVMQAIAHSETGSYLASLSSEQRANLAQQVSQSTGFDSGEVKSFLNTTARHSSLVHDQSWSQAQSNNRMAEVGAGVGVGVAGVAGGAGSGSPFSLSSRQNETSIKSLQNSQSHAQGLQDKEGFQINNSRDAKLVDSVVKALQEMSSSGNSASQQYSRTSTDTNSLTSSLSALEQVASQNSFLQARSASISATQSYSPLALANMVNSSPAQQAYLQQMIDSSPSLQASSIAQQQLLQSWTPDREQARTAASLMAVFSDQSQQGLQRQQALVSQLMFMGLGSNYQTPEHEVNNLASQQGSLTAQVEQARSRGQASLNQSSAQIKQGTQGLSDSYRLDKTPRNARGVSSPKLGKVSLPTSVDE